MIFKKPNFWDLKKPNLISYLLLPLTIPIIINNFFLKFKSSKKNQHIKTICIGNIYVGGTGKTPTTMKLYEILRNLKFNVSTAKKFYKSHSDENAILKNNTQFITAKNRLKILDKAINKGNNIVIFDDGLQDRSIDYDLKLVCFDTINFIGNGQLIPSGPLREKLESMKKYDGVFLKSDSEIPANYLNLITKHNSNLKIFETYFEIKNLDKFNLNDNYLIFSGIGNHQSFKNLLLKNKFNIVKEIRFPDHYNYKKIEIQNIKHKAKNLNAKIITTEKDFLRILPENSNDIHFLNVKINIKNEKNLIDFLKQKINE